MGDRANVFVRHGANRGIFLYSHWGGWRMADTVTRFLRTTQRWDADYFTRNLLNNMTADAVSGERDLPRGFNVIGHSRRTGDFRVSNNEAAIAVLGAFVDELSYGIALTRTGDEYPLIVLDSGQKRVWLLDDSDAFDATDVEAQLKDAPSLSFDELQTSIAELVGEEERFVDWARFKIAFAKTLMNA